MCSWEVNLVVILQRFYVAFNSQGHIATGSLHVEETSAYCTVNYRALASNYQLSNMKRPAPRFEQVASEVGGENSNFCHFIQVYQCLHGRLGSVVVSRPVGESQ